MLFQNSLLVLPQNLSDVSSSNLVFKRYGMYWFLMSLTTTVVGTVSTVLLVLGTIWYGYTVVTAGTTVPILYLLGQLLAS